MSFFNPRSDDFVTVIIAKKFKISLLFPILLTASIYGGFFGCFLLSYVGAFLHELGHIAAAKCFKIRVSYIKIQPFGICVRLKSDIIKNPSSEIIVALCGPIINVFLAFFTVLFEKYIPGSKYFFVCNILIAAINLLPALPLDGGRILRAVLTLRCSSVRAYNITVRFSRIIIIFLCIISVILLVTAKFNFSLILISAFLLGNLFSEQYNITRSAVVAMDYKDKIKNAELRHLSLLMAKGSESARKIFRFLSYNKYYIVYVCNDKMGISGILTESEILDAIFNGGVRLTFNDILHR